MIQDKMLRKLILAIIIALAVILNGCVADRNDSLYPITEEEYMMGWALHNIDESTKTDLAYSESDTAVYKYSFNYPAHSSLTYDNLAYWVSPIEDNPVGSIARFAAPQDRTYYVRGDEVSDEVYSHGWSFANSMLINYLKSDDLGVQGLLNLVSEEHYQSENTLNALKPVPGKKEQIFMGTSPFTPASVILSTQKNKAPKGWLDEITPVGIIRGWAYDPDWPDEQIDVHIYIDNPAGSGTPIGVATNVLREDVNREENVEGKHGYEFAVPQSYRDGKPHSVYVYGIDKDDASGNSNTKLDGVPKSFTISPDIKPPAMDPSADPTRYHKPTIKLNGELIRGYNGKSYLKRQVYAYGDRFLTLMQPPKYAVYLDNQIVQKGEFVGIASWDYTKLQHSIDQAGQYRVEIEIPSGYPTFNKVIMQSSFNYNNKPVALPVLKHIEFPPRFAINEKLPISVEFENDNSVNKFEMYYKTNTMPDWSFLGESKNTEIVITDSNAKQINFKFIAHTTDGSSSYEITPISMKSVDIFCQHIVDKSEKGFVLRGRCFDKKADSVPGIRIEFYSAENLIGSAMTDGEGKYDFEVTRLPKDLNIKFKGTGVFNPAAIQAPVPPIIEFFSVENKNTTLRNNDISQQEKITLAWRVANAEKVTLNPGNVDVTGKQGLEVSPKSDTIYNLVAESKGQKAVATAFVKAGKRLPKITGLWVGPWYTPKDVAPYIDDAKTVTSLKRDFGANTVMYNLDWLFYNWIPLSNPYDLNKYISFCQARISEAEASNVYLFFHTNIPFVPSISKEDKIKALEKLKPCFTNPKVLGIHTIDEATGISISSPSLVSKEAMQEGYNLFKEMYPDKLVWHNEGILDLPGAATLEQARGWDWGDIISMDWYVIPRPSLENLEATITPAIKNAKKLAGERDTWFIHQAVPMSIFKDQPETSREPTPEELKLLADLSWQNGLTGVVWWGMVQNNLLPQHAQSFTSNGEGFRKEFVPDENFKKALREINSNPPKGSTSQQLSRGSTSQSTNRGSVTVAQRDNPESSRDIYMKRKDYDDLVQDLRRDALIEEIKYGINDLPSALKKARDSGLEVYDKGNVEGGNSPGYIIIWDPNDGEILLTITRQADLRTPNIFSDDYWICNYITIPLIFRYGKPDAMITPKIRIGYPKGPIYDVPSAYVSAALEQAMATWNNIPNIPHFEFSRDSTSFYDIEMKMSASISLAADTSFADTTLAYSKLGPHAVIRINEENYNENMARLANTLTHELGHVLGLADDFHDSQSIMSWSRDRLSEPKISNDVVKAIREITSTESNELPDCQDWVTYYNTKGTSGRFPPNSRDQTSQNCNLDRLRSACKDLSTSTTSCTPSEGACQCLCRTSCDLVELDKRCQSESAERGEICTPNGFHCNCGCGNARILPGRPDTSQEALTGRDYFTNWNNGFWTIISSQRSGGGGGASVTTFACFWNPVTRQCQAF